MLQHLFCLCVNPSHQKYVETFFSKGYHLLCVTVLKICPLQVAGLPGGDVPGGAAAAPDRVRVPTSPLSVLFPRLRPGAGRQGAHCYHQTSDMQPMIDDVVQWRLL